MGKWQGIPQGSAGPPTGSGPSQQNLLRPPFHSEQSPTSKSGEIPASLWSQISPPASCTCTPPPSAVRAAVLCSTIYTGCSWLGPTCPSVSPQPGLWANVNPQRLLLWPQRCHGPCGLSVIGRRGVCVSTKALAGRGLSTRAIVSPYVVPEQCCTPDRTNNPEGTWAASSVQHTRPAGV